MASEDKSEVTEEELEKRTRGKKQFNRCVT
jgi:hypothetical protein